MFCISLKIQGVFDFKISSCQVITSFFVIVFIRQVIGIQPNLMHAIDPVWYVGIYGHKWRQLNQWAQHIIIIPVPAFSHITAIEPAGKFCCSKIHPRRCNCPWQYWSSDFPVKCRLLHCCQHIRRNGWHLQKVSAYRSGLLLHQNRNWKRTQGHGCSSCRN